jgi:hypothetical protein
MKQRCCGPFFLHDNWLYSFVMDDSGKDRKWPLARISTRGQVERFDALKVGVNLYPVTRPYWEKTSTPPMPPMTGIIEYIPEKNALLVCDETRLSLLHFKE